VLILPFRTGRWAATVCSLTLLFFFSGRVVSGEENSQGPLNSTTTPRNISVDGIIGEWESSSPTLTLHKYQQNSRDGIVWVGQTNKGIVIAGKVYGDKPRWPKSSDKMVEGDHIEVWLADGQELKMPPIGWGMQFGFNTLKSEEDCSRPELAIPDKTRNDVAVKNCRAWFATQVSYRKTFRKLFLRQWQIAPNTAIETYSTPAFRSLTSLQTLLQLLDPSGTPVVRFNDSVRKDHAYSFEILIPWNAFPPMKPLQLSDVRIMVDVFNPGTGARKHGDFSSTASKRKYGQPDTFNTLKLDPIDYFITPCKYDIPNFGSDVMAPNAWHDSPVRDPLYPNLGASKSASIYFIPTASRDVRRLLLLDNEAGGYFWRPEPGIYSPIVSAITYYTTKIGTAEAFCAPQLSYVKNDKIYKSNYFINHAPFEIKKKSDSVILVKEGPEDFQTRFASGYCGACPWAMLKMYFVDAVTGEIKQAFEYEERLEGSEDNDIVDIDIHVSESWDTLTVFEEHLSYDTDDKKRKEESREWSATKYCFNRTSKTYEECGEEYPSPPPSYRVLSFSKYKG